MTLTLPSFFFVHPAVLYKLYQEKIVNHKYNFLLSVLIFITKFFGRLGRHEVIQENYKIFGGF